MLKIEDLHISFSQGKKKFQAVRGISLKIGPGEIVGLVGGSGSGKSVTAQSILQLLPKNSSHITGNIYFEGKDLLKRKETKINNIRGNRIGMVFQNPANSLNPTRKIGLQIMESILEHKKTSKHEAHHIAVEWLHKVGIADPSERMDQYPFQLSGGMCQRVMIAIALSCDPSLLLADEPTTALDATIRMQIIELFKQKRKKLGTSILFITHDLGAVAGLCDRVYIMYEGQIVEHGNVDEIFYSPKHTYTQNLLGAQRFLNE